MTWNFDKKNAELSGRIFHDTDGDNTEKKASGGYEPGIAGQEVKLLNVYGHVIKTTHTDHAGNYKFSHLPAGTYTIQFPAAIGQKALVEKDVGDYRFDSDADQHTGKTIQIHLGKGQTQCDIDAGYRVIGDGTVEGSNGDDTIDLQYTGDPEGDRVDAGDAILPGAAPDDDLILAKGGNDTVKAGEGDDIVYGGTGNDTLFGEAGDDTLFGGRGHDLLKGGDGEDVLFGNEGNDTIYGGTGDDIIYGGTPSADGSEGGVDPVAINFSDVKSGSETAGHPNTATANDSVIYKNAAVLEDGTVVSVRLVLVGKSNEHLKVDLANSDDYEILLNANNNSHMLGETATFRMEFFNQHTGHPVSLNPAIVFADLDKNGGAEIISIHDEKLVNVGVPAGSSLDVHYSGGPSVVAKGTQDNIDPEDPSSQFLAVYGTTSDISFTMTSRAFNSGLNFGEADGHTYEYLGDDGNNTLFGDEGNDLIYGGNGDDVIRGGEGNDTIYGGDGDDSATGEDGDDLLFGGAGNDTLRGGMGEDVLYGGAGDDSLSGGPGNDTIFGDAGNDVIEGGSGDDTIYGGAGDDSIIAGSGDDVVYSGSGNNTITTGDGNDTVYLGDDGNFVDTSGHVPLPDIGFPGLYPADPNPFDDRDTVYGGAGDDTIFTGDDRDTIFGGAGNDYIDAGIDDDYVEGGDGDDTIIGGEGRDVIHGGAGNDVIYGGLDMSFPDDINIPDDGSGPFGPDPVPNNNNDTIYGGDGDDTIYGMDDDDVLYGGKGDDVIYGGVDNDLIYGDKGDDTLYGDQGDDTIYGGLGDDVIIGGSGSDKLFGGFGSDTFLGGTTDDHVVGGEDPDDSDIDVLDLTGSDVDFIDYDDPDVGGGAGDAESGRVYFLDGTTMTFEEIENVIPCFTPGTTIATPRGERLVEELREGDRIITRDNGIQEIRWVGKKLIGGKALVQNPHLKPVLIKAGSLGNGLPERDMLVSPNHRMLVANDMTQLYFEEREVLAAAKHLVGSEGIHEVDVMQTTYIHFMFDRHEVVLSNGAWTESFQPGDYSLKGLGNAQRTEIFELFPELQDRPGLEGYQAARRSLKKHEAQLLVK